MARKKLISQRSRSRSGIGTPSSAPRQVDVQLVVSTVEEEVQNQGFRILPSAESIVVKVINRSVATGVIRDQEQATISAAALLIAGAQEAHEAGTLRVRPVHVVRGWNDRLASTGGNCPPHKCLKRSILTRVSALREELTDFNRIVSAVQEKLDL